MSWGRRRVLAGLCVLVLLASVTVTPVAGEETPTVAIAIDGESVTGGSETIVRSDPSVTVSVEASSPVELVDVRVDGVIRWSHTPDTESVETTVPLELDSGASEVRVVANAAGVSSASVTVIKDDQRPRVAYTAPFETSALAGVPDEVRVEAAETTLAGNLSDAAGVDRISIAREYTYAPYRGADTPRSSRVQHRMSDPNGSFDQPMLFGDGSNNVTARYTDRLGQTRVDEFVVVVDDTTAPRIDVSAPEQTRAGTVRLTGTVRDAVKVRSLRVRALDGSGRVLVQTDAEPDPDRLAVELDETIELRDGTNDIVVEASDPAGNTARETLTVAVVDDADPQVTLTTAVTDEQVQVRGRVDGAITRVTLESVDASTGERLDVVRVHESAESVGHVRFEESLTAVTHDTAVRVLVTDDAGEQHEHTAAVAGRETAANASQESGEADGPAGERGSEDVESEGVRRQEPAGGESVSGEPVSGESVSEEPVGAEPVSRESGGLEAADDAETTGGSAASDGSEMPTSRRERLVDAVRGVADTARRTAREQVLGTLGTIRDRLPLVAARARGVTGWIASPGV